MHKIFISQPMSDRSIEEIQKERYDAFIDLHAHFKLAEDTNFEIIDNLQLDLEEEAETYKRPRLFYLGNSIKMLGEADYIYFIGDYEKSTGCIMEKEIAMYYGIPILKINKEVVDVDDGTN